MRILSTRLAFVAAIQAITITSLPAASFAVDGQATKLASTLSRQPKAFWRAFMPEFYGPYDKGKKCWIGKADGNEFCMRPHTFDLVTSGKDKLLFVTAAGSTTAADNDCHACAGNIGLFVLNIGSSNMKLTASSDRYIEDGSNGSPAPEDGFHVLQIGKDGAYGWTEDNGWTGMGVTVERTQVFATIGDKVRSIGWLPHSYDDSGNCENGKLASSGEPCSNISFEATFDTGSQHKRFANVVLRGSGTLKGKPFSETYVVPFDEKTFSYTLPSNLPEEMSN